MTILSARAAPPNPHITHASATARNNPARILKPPCLPPQSTDGSVVSLARLYFCVRKYVKRRVCIIQRDNTIVTRRPAAIPRKARRKPVSAAQVELAGRILDWLRH